MYFCGADQFSCCALETLDPITKQTNVPIKVGELYKVIMRHDLAVFQTSLRDESPWFARGFGVPNLMEVFPGTLNVTQISLCDRKAIGLNERDGSLYKVNFIYNDTEKKLDLKTGSSIKIVDSTVRIKQISTNDKECFGIDDDGGIYQIDDEISLKWRLDGVSITTICCSFDHFCILNDAGAVYSWGNGRRGQLGHREALLTCEEPKRVEFFDDLPSIVTQLVCGGWHTMALTSDGDIYSWGWNDVGQVGHSGDKICPFSSDPYPIDLGSASDPVISVAAGCRHSSALLKSGKVYTWGLNKQGQLGLGDVEDRTEPTEISFHFENKPTKIRCGRWATFVYI